MIKFVILIEVINLFKCPHCKKENAVKAGLRKNKSGFVQKYFCNCCKKYFVKRQGFENCQTKPEIIVEALDLRAKGLSLEKVAQHLNQKYGTKINDSTISRWVKKFGELINNFTKQFILPYSHSLHADEVFFRAKGQRERDFVFYWDAIDYDTKFLVADHISLVRNFEEGTKFMQKIQQQLGEPPGFLNTDNSYDYPVAIKKVFGKTTKHIHYPAHKCKFKNNPIERYHNTVRENYKVMRRFVNEKTAQIFLNFFRNYYNFIRPHKTLKWKTPAEVAGFGKWNWWSLIKFKTKFIFGY